MGGFIKNILCWSLIVFGVFVVCVGAVDCLDWEAKRALQYGSVVEVGSE